MRGKHRPSRLLLSCREMKARSCAGPCQLPADCRAPEAMGLPACLHSQPIVVEVWSLATRARRDPAPKDRMAAIKASSVTSFEVGAVTRRDVLCDGGSATNFDLIVASVAGVSGASPMLLARCTGLPGRSLRENEMTSLRFLTWPRSSSASSSVAVCGRLRALRGGLIGLGHLHAFQPEGHALSRSPASHAIGDFFLASFATLPGRTNKHVLANINHSIHLCAREGDPESRRSVNVLPGVRSRVRNVTSRTAQSNLRRFQHWLTQTFPVCQRHHVFLSTRVHDHIRQVTRLVRREIGVVAEQTKRPTGVRKYHRLTVPTRVEFLFPPPPQQPEHLRSHQKIDTHGSNDHACHRGCNSRFDEGSQVVDDRPVHYNCTCLCLHGSCRLCQISCHCCSRDLTCQQISHVVCTSL